MKLLVFSVFDVKAEAYLAPFFSPTIGMALRDFTSAANDQNHQFWKHAEDYTLFQVGEFDQVKGELETMAPKALGTALQYREIEEGIMPSLVSGNGRVAEIKRTEGTPAGAGDGEAGS